MFARLLAAGLIALAAPYAAAQQYPSKPVRIIVPFAPGGGSDFTARLMAQKLTERIKQELGRNVRIEGLPIADWVLIDADDVIVHLFRPEVRTFYNLERMWSFEESSAPRPAAGHA